MNPASDLIFRNYAAPVDNAAPTETQLNEFTAFLYSYNRVLRLEFVPADASALEAILLDAGFSVDL